MRSNFRIAILGAAALLTFGVAGAISFHHPESAAREKAYAGPDHPFQLAFAAEADSPDALRNRAEEIMIDETFSVQPGEALLANVVHGDVHIEKSAGNKARIRVALEGREITDRLRDFFEYLNFEVGQTDGQIFVRANPDGNWSWKRSGWRMKGGVHVYISVPEVFDAEIDVAHGDLDIQSLKGALNIDLAHGDIAAGSLGGSLLSMHIAHGDVQTGQVGSESIRLDLQHGDLAANSVDAQVMDVRTAHGDIDADRVVAETVRIRTAHGDIDLDHISVGEIDADLSHGDIHVHGMDGYPKMATRHGDIRLHFLEAAGGEFRTSHGDIELFAPAEAALNVDFHASDIAMGGAFQAGFEGMRKDKEALGRVNGGGPELRARASHGGIGLRAR